MQKKGFTIQEVLITIAIVGVVAAMIVPSVQKIMPDKTKVQYMKVYNTLTSQLSDILDDSSLYWTTYDNSTGNPNCEGMTCADKPAIEPYQSDNACLETSKFPAILSHRLNLASDPIYTNPGGAFVSIASFTTTDGTLWRFRTLNPPNQNMTTEVSITLSSDPNPNVPANYFAANNQNPSRFKFIIKKDGEIVAGDVLGAVFLQNPTNFHAIQEDRALATKVLEEAGSSTPTTDKLYEALNKVLKEAKQTSTQ